MSLNMITPSGLKASQGCNESLRAMSVVSERSLKLYLSEYLRPMPSVESQRGVHGFFSGYHVKFLSHKHVKDKSDANARERSTRQST